MKFRKALFLRYWRKYLLPLTLLSGLLTFYYFDINSLINWAYLVDNYREIKLITQTDINLAYLVFCVIYFFAVALSLPIALILTLLGGALFGWVAVLLCIPVGTMGCWVVFVATRGFLSDYLAKLANPYLSRVAKNFNAAPFSWLLLFRLIPVLPMWLGNIIPGILGMSTKSFLLATSIGFIPGTIIYVSFARGLDRILINGSIPSYSIVDNFDILIPLLILFLIACISLTTKYMIPRRK